MTESIRDLILALRAPEMTPEFIELHTRLQLAKQEGKLTDEMLAECKEGECLACGMIVCPHHEPLHFHHDGCPACSSEEYIVPEWVPETCPACGSDDLHSASLSGKEAVECCDCSWIATHESLKP